MFLVFEGHDGVGKTTQIEKVAEYYRKLGRDVIVVRTPGGTPIAEICRTISNKPVEGDVATATARNLLMAAARAQTWESTIQPALQRGSIVIADRWVWSGYLYQVVGERLSYSDWKIINRQVLSKAAAPDITFVLTLDESDRIVRKRMLNETTSDLDLMEQQGSEFENAISKAIFKCDELAMLSNRIVVIKQNATTTIDEVFDDILSHVAYLENVP